MAVLRITYTLTEGPGVTLSTTTSHDIGDESWRVIPAIRQAVEGIVTREPTDAEYGLDPAMVKTLSRWLDDTPTDLDRALAVLWLAEDKGAFLAARQQVLALVEQRHSEAVQSYTTDDPCQFHIDLGWVSCPLPRGHEGEHSPGSRTAQQALDRIEAWCVAQDRYSKGESPTTHAVRAARRGES